MRTRTIGYRAFLLRVWTRPDGGGPRSLIRDVETGETHAFDGLDKLREWLESETTPPRSEETPSR